MSDKKILVPIDRLHLTKEQAEIMTGEYPDGVTAPKAKILRPLVFFLVKAALIAGIVFRPEPFVDLTWVAIVALWILSGVLGLGVIAVAVSDDKASPEFFGMLRKRPLMAGLSMLTEVSWVVALAWHGAVFASIALFLAEANGWVLLGILRMVVATKITNAIEESKESDGADEDPGELPKLKAVQ